MSDVVRSALRLLQEAEERRRRFTAMLQAVEEETDREGAVTLETVLAELDEVIDEYSR